MITVIRCENSYRDYDTAAVERLKQIKVLRDIGISISDIKLYFNNILSIDEVLSKRKRALEDEQQSFDAKSEAFSRLFYSKTASGKQSIATKNNNVILGIDIGTTTLSFIVADIDSMEIIENYCIDNDSRIINSNQSFKEQDVNLILKKILNTVDFLTASFPNTRSIGITGQMHGVVCIDKSGTAVSPLYTWQDNRADQALCNEIKEKTNEKIFSGYGHATLYYNYVNNLIPHNAVTYCTVMDYIAMQLTGLKKPIIHSSNAASLGLFDLEKKEFNTNAIEQLGLSALSIPETTDSDKILGFYKNIPVSVAIGDNQAAVFGSVKNEEKSVLVNYGTGSQVSLISDTPIKIDGIEVRPYINGKYLLCYSALCGGRAYAILENFFRQYITESENKQKSQYAVMDELALKAYNANQDNLPKVSTLFCGERENPESKGSILFLDEKNFTPENIVLGVIKGMVDELAEKYKTMKADNRTELIASGNAVQKGLVLRKVLADTFGMKCNMSTQKEEAALGAALYSGVCSKIITFSKAKEFINYTEE